MDSSKLNLVVATAALQGMGYSSERLRQFFERSHLLAKEQPRAAKNDPGYFEAAGRLSVDGSPVARYNPVLDQFKCFYCGVTGGVTRTAEHYLSEHVDLASRASGSAGQHFRCPKCTYMSDWPRCVRMHLNKQHGLAEIPASLWAETHPLLGETIKLLQELKNFVNSHVLLSSNSNSIPSMLSSADTSSNVACPNLAELGTNSAANVEGSLSDYQDPAADTNIASSLIPRTAGSSSTSVTASVVPGSSRNRHNASPSATTTAASGINASATLVKKRYTCEQCAYSTDRRDLYNRHENIHKEDKPFHCYVCHKLFNRADHVKKHFLRIHKGRAYNVALIRRRGASSSANNHSQILVPRISGVSTAAAQSLPTQVVSVYSQANTRHSLLPSTVVTAISNSSRCSHESDGIARSRAALMTPLATSLTTSLAPNANANNATAAAILAETTRTANTPSLAVSLANDGVLGVLGSTSSLTPLAAFALAHQRATAATAHAATTVLSSATTTDTNSGLTASLTTLTALGRVRAAAARAAQAAKASIAQILQPDSSAKSGSSASIPLVVPIGPITPAVGTIHEGSNFVCHSTTPVHTNNNHFKQEIDASGCLISLATADFDNAKITSNGINLKTSKDLIANCQAKSKSRVLHENDSVVVNGPLQAPLLEKAVVSLIVNQQQSRTTKRKADSLLPTSPSIAKSKVLVETPPTSLGPFTPPSSVISHLTTAVDLAAPQVTSPVVRSCENSNSSEIGIAKAQEAYTESSKSATDRAQQKLHGDDVTDCIQPKASNRSASDRPCHEGHKMKGIPKLKQERDLNDDLRSEKTKETRSITSADLNHRNPYVAAGLDSGTHATLEFGINTVIEDRPEPPRNSSLNSRRNNTRRSTRMSSSPAVTLTSSGTTTVTQVLVTTSDNLSHIHAGDTQTAAGMQLPSICTRQQAAQQRFEDKYQKFNGEKQDSTITDVARTTAITTKYSCDSSTPSAESSKNISRIATGVEVTIVLPPPPALTPKLIDKTDEPPAISIDNRPSKQFQQASNVPIQRSSSSPSSDSTGGCSDTSFGTALKKREAAVLEPSQVKEYTCDQCSWRGVDGWGLRRHMNTHLKPFRCQLCDYRAARSERLGAHVLRVHGKHLCAKCENLSFPNAAALDHHVRTAHRSTNQYTRPLPNAGSPDLSINGTSRCIGSVTVGENSNKSKNNNRSSNNAVDEIAEIYADDDSDDGELLVDDNVDDNRNSRDNNNETENTIFNPKANLSNETRYDLYALPTQEASSVKLCQKFQATTEVLNQASVCLKMPLGQIHEANANNESLTITDPLNTRSEASFENQQLNKAYSLDKIRLQKISICGGENEENDQLSNSTDVLQLVDESDVEEGVDTFFCPWCILSFADELSLAYHLEARHPGAPVGTATFALTSAAENVSNESAQASRKSQHHHGTPAFPYQCTICGFKCFTQGTIMEHMRIHSGQLSRCRADAVSGKHPQKGQHTQDSRKKVGGFGSSTSSRSARCGFISPFDSELTRHVVNLHLGGLGGVYSDYTMKSDDIGISASGSCLAQACCAHCGLAVNRSEELMRHIKAEHHIAPLECNLCRKALLEFFPSFYGRICPSTAPTANQYTRIPPHLLLRQTSKKGSHQRKTHQHHRPDKTGSTNCRKQPPDSACADNMDLKSNDGTTGLNVSRHGSTKDLDKNYDDGDDGNEPEYSDTEETDIKKSDSSGSCGDTIIDNKNNHSSINNNPRGFLSRLLTSVYRQLAEHRSLDATTASIILNTIQKLNHNYKNSNATNYNGNSSTKANDNNDNNEQTNKGHDRSYSHRSLIESQSIYAGSTNQESNDILNDELSSQSRKRTAKSHIVTSSTELKRLLSGKLSAKGSINAADQTSSWSKAGEREVQFSNTTAPTNKKNQPTAMAKPLVRPDRSQAAKHDQNSWLPLSSLRKKGSRCARCPNTNISFQTPGAKKVHVLVKHRIRTALKWKKVDPSDLHANNKADVAEVSISLSSMAIPGMCRSKTSIKERNHKDKPFGGDVWQKSKPKGWKNRSKQRDNKSRCGLSRQTERACNSGPSLRSRKKQRKL